MKAAQGHLNDVVRFSAVDGPGNRFVADQMLMALGVKSGGGAASGALAHSMKTLDGKDVNLAEKYKGKVVLMVNVASKCGLTPTKVASKVLVLVKQVSTSSCHLAL